MAFDAFLKLDGIDGECQAEGFAKTIQIYSFSWGASNPSTIGSGSAGSGGGRCSISGFNTMKTTDKSSPKLFQHCCAGTHIKTALVSIRKSSGDTKGPQVFLTYNFEQVFVDSIQWSGSSGGDDRPTESVSFSFATVKISYKEQGGDGKLGGAIEAGWDIVKNVAK